MEGADLAQDADYVKSRGKERDFMDAFARGTQAPGQPACRWQQLLSNLGEQHTRPCRKRCTLCDPQGTSQQSLDPMAAESCLYITTTPGGFKVYAQKKGRSDVAPSATLWKSLIDNKHIDMVVNGLRYVLGPILSSIQAAKNVFGAMARDRCLVLEEHQQLG